MTNINDNDTVSIYDCVILGSGPAGNTAALYLARASKNVLVLAGITTPGGALTNTTDIENFPGFPDGIAGAELVGRQQEQAEKFGAVYEYDEVKTVDFSGDIKVLNTQMGSSYEAKTVIIATGSIYRTLGLENESNLVGRGVSYCATCDGFFFKGKDVVVVGGGDTAVEEAIYLANLCNNVKIIHRRNEFRAEQIMLDRAKEHSNIEFLTPFTISSIESTVDDSGVEKVSGVTIKNTETSEDAILTVSGVFAAIGSDPQTAFLSNAVKLDDSGYIVVDGQNPNTSVSGVFAAGDCCEPNFRQAIVAAGDGAKAAIEAERYLQ